jgi:hypothetical protein
MVRDDWGFRIGYSPDGLVGDDGLIEVKSRRQKKQLQTILADEVPAENMAQLQCGLLVSGPQVDRLRVLLRRDAAVDQARRARPRWFKAIVAAVAQFELNADEMVTAYRTATEGLAATERVAELEMI